MNNTDENVFRLMRYPIPVLKSTFVSQAMHSKFVAIQHPDIETQGAIAKPSNTKHGDLTEHCLAALRTRAIKLRLPRAHCGSQQPNNRTAGVSNSL